MKSHVNRFVLLCYCCFCFMIMFVYVACVCVYMHCVFKLECVCLKVRGWLWGQFSPSTFTWDRFRLPDLRASVLMGWAMSPAAVNGFLRFRWQNTDIRRMDWHLAPKQISVCTQPKPLIVAVNVQKFLRFLLFLIMNACGCMWVRVHEEGIGSLGWRWVVATWGGHWEAHWYWKSSKCPGALTISPAP